MSTNNIPEDLLDLINELITYDQDQEDQEYLEYAREYLEDMLDYGIHDKEKTDSTIIHISL